MNNRISELSIPLETYFIKSSFFFQEIETKNPHLIDKLKKLKYLAEASQ